MGDPRKIRKKFTSPSHPWERARIEQERVIIQNYALKNKREIWKANSLLKSFKNQAKKLSSLRTAQAEKEQQLLIQRLARMGLLKAGADMESILTLRLEDLLERRLQTVAVKKGLARSMNQARQFITHGHIAVGEQVITSPSYLVTGDEEQSVSFRGASKLSDEEHPERAVAEKPKKAEKKAEASEGKKGAEGKREEKQPSEASEKSAPVKKEVKEEKKAEKKGEGKEAGAPKAEPEKKEEAKQAEVKDGE